MIKAFILLFFSLLLISCSRNIYQQKERFIKFKNTGRHININLKIDKYDEGIFYFDTGSGWLIIDSTFYNKQKMAFNHLTNAKIKGVGNNYANMTQILDTVKFSTGNNVFFSNYNLIYNLKKILGKDIDGIVGFVNFGDTPFEVNYVTQKITLNPKIDNTYQEVKIKFNGYDMLMPIEVTFADGTIVKGDFLIDTGSKETTFTSEFIYSKGILNSKKATYISNGGIGGTHTGHSFFINNLKIDNFNIQNSHIDISLDSLGALSKSENYIGIVGNDILDDFDIIYHPTQSKIWIKPNKKFNKPSNDLYKPFVLIESDNVNRGWIIGSIYKESDAYKKGLRNNDEIVEINNKSVQKLNSEKFMTKLKPNQKLKLKVKRANEYFEINTHLNVFLKKND